MSGVACDSPPRFWVLFRRVPSLVTSGSVHIVTSVVHILTRKGPMPNNYASHVLRTYGRTEEDIDAQAASQNYLCAICERENVIAGKVRRLEQDHSHVTNQNRDLLCARCNKVCGFLRDDQELIKRFLAYLIRHHGVQSEPYIPDNPETRGVRDAAFERSLQLLADPSGIIQEEELLPAGFRSDLSSLADKPAPCELD